MTERRATFRWPAPRATADAPRPAPAAPLAERLAELAQDRATPADALVAEASAVVWGWVLEQPARWEVERAAVELEGGLAAFAGAHGWRGATALWLDALRSAFRAGLALGRTGPRQALLEELAQWQLAPDEAAPGRDAAHEWNGQPLAPGRRLPRRSTVGARAAAALQPGELVLVAVASDVLSEALLAAGRGGAGPEVLVGLGGLERAGCRLARELAAAGLRVRLASDAALPAALARADRVWLGTEAIGAGSFVAPAGTGFLLEEARRRGVPIEGLATRDALLPGGRLELPLRPEEDDWLLWCDAPPGVALESALYEAVGLELVDRWWTEVGRESARELVLRSLRPKAEPPLA